MEQRFWPPSAPVIGVRWTTRAMRFGSQSQAKSAPRADASKTMQKNYAVYRRYLPGTSRQ